MKDRPRLPIVAVPRPELVAFAVAVEDRLRDERYEGLPEFHVPASLVELLRARLAILASTVNQTPHKRPPAAVWRAAVQAEVVVLGALLLRLSEAVKDV